MMKSVLHALLALIFSLAIQQSMCESVLYVKPSDSTVCLFQPCHTLQQYTQQLDRFFTTGTTFVFFTGNHSLLTTISLSNVANITFRGLGTVSVLHGQEGSIICNNVKNFIIEGMTFVFQSRDFLTTFNCNQVKISNTIFRGMRKNGSLTRAIRSSNSTIMVESCLFEGNAGEFGGAMLAFEGSYILLTRNTFMQNHATKNGGAICASGSIVHVNEPGGTTFAHNSATIGGALALYNSSLFFTVNTTTKIGRKLPETGTPRSNTSSWVLFHNNTAKAGGSIHSYNSNVSLTKAACLFILNSATYGGAIYAIRSNITANTLKLQFVNNTALRGGAISVNSNSSLLLAGEASFKYNRANWGGALLFFNSKALISNIVVELSYNIAIRGGGIFSLNSQVLFQTDFLQLSNNQATYLGGGFFLSESKVVIHGTTQMDRNTAQLGGGFFVGLSHLSSVGRTSLDSNAAQQGGAVYSISSHISCSGATVAQHNTAKTDGGAFYLSESNLVLSQAVNISSNTAKNGGAMYINSAVCKAALILEPHTILTAADNRASEYGGALYHNDRTTPVQCRYIFSKEVAIFNTYLPQCFLQLRNLSTLSIPFLINSLNNSAGIDGNFLSGGLLERCHMDTNTSVKEVPFKLLMNQVIQIQSAENLKNEVTSKPYQLCFCKSNHQYNCSGVINKVLYTGQKFNISLLALAQGGTTTSTIITAKVSSMARLKINQSTQSLLPNCNILSYNLYSISTHEELILYPDGPCRDTELAVATVNVTFLPCPDGFVQDGEVCTCEERLQKYDVECIIDENSYIKREEDSRVWMQFLYENNTYQGLIMYKNCPGQYCTKEAVHITSDNMDIQCGLHRSGVLCGGCATNYSLMLGSSKCQICSNAYLSLLIPFLVAGLALVGFLIFLKLTVATGMINSIILYANIVQANKVLFLPINKANVITIFIAWLNLDFGFQTCFYDGMDAYAHTWLQFAFPIYIWILISLIIIISRYSMTASKLIGSNPVAVLATLLLMSYTKVLKIVIEVYHAVELDYPNNKTATVWLKDANVPYLKSKHLLLTVVTSLVLLFLFLPYTLLLLLGYKLYRFTDRKYFYWLNKIKPLLDAYYAPYKMHTRYWTGFLLLVRCALYIVFSFGSLGTSLLAIIIAFTALAILAWLSIELYENFYVNIIEASIYLNLIILSTAMLADISSQALVYTLVGIVLGTTIGIIIYHFHHLYIAKSALWLRAKAKICTLESSMQASNELPPHIPTDTSSSYHSLDTTTTMVPLREPFLDDQ